MTPRTLFLIILTIYIADFVFGRYLSWLNIRSSKNPIPAELSGIYDSERYHKQQQYFRANSRFGMTVSSFSFVVIMAMLLFGGFASINDIVQSWSLSAVWTSIAFLGILYIANDLIELPFDIYDTFVIEQRFGFNKTTAGTFVFDRLKGYLLTAIIGGALLYAVIYIYNAIPQYFWILAWAVVSVFGLFMSVFYSDIIVPIFNKQKPLVDGELRRSIEQFADRVGFSLKNIYTIDGSKRSTKANAYFTGMFGKKRIVLYDTLIEKLSTEEIVAVLAHEIGHYKHRHTMKSMVMSLLSNLLLFWLLGIVLGNDIFARALGCTSASFHINILVFGILYSPISTVLGVSMNVLSRKFEYQADGFAKQYGYGAALVSALGRLSSDSLSNLTPHRLVVFTEYSHPTLYQRIKELNK